MLHDNMELIHPTAAGFWKQLTTPQHNIYAPLTFGLWYVIAAVTTNGETLPAIGFKVASWLGHGLSALAAWWAIWLIVRHRAAAMIGAMVVALHPLQVESVAWTTGTKDVLCGLFSFAAIALYTGAITGGRRRALYWAVACGVFAVAAKPTGVVLPAILFAVDLAIRDTSIQRRLGDLWPFLPATGVGVLVILCVQPATSIEPAPLHLRPLIALDSYAFYLQKVVSPTNLVVDYARSPDVVRASGQLAWTWVVPLAVLALAIVSRHRMVGLAVVMFAIPILPVSGITAFDMQQYSTVTDHYAYQSLLGVGLIVAVAARRWIAARYILGTTVAALAVLSVLQIRYWLDPHALYARGVELAPQTLMSRAGLVTLAFDRGDPADAERWARQIIQIKPRADAYINLSVALVQQNRLPEAAEAAKQALRLDGFGVEMNSVRYWLLLARDLNDTELARLTAAYWAKLEPANPAPRTLLRSIEASEARSASTRPATQPAD
jgi:protein O-mannosyl-transferase